MKTKSNKVAKSAKTRLSDLTPKKDARGGGAAEGPGATPPYKLPPVASTVKKPQHLTS
jgi:hypothetical protein